MHIYMYTDMYICIYVYMYTHTHTHTHTHMYTRARARAHTHTNTHTHKTCYMYIRRTGTWAFGSEREEFATLQNGMTTQFIMLNGEFPEVCF